MLIINQIIKPKIPTPKIKQETCSDYVNSEQKYKLWMDINIFER